MEINFTRIFGRFGWVGKAVSRKLQILMIRLSRGRRRFAHLTPGQQEILKAKNMRRLARLAVGVLIFGGVGFFVMFAWYSRELPKPGEVIRREGFSTKLYDRDGTLLYDLYDTQRRTPVTLEDTPTYLEQATVAVEDKDFYRHGGFDLLTVLRIPYNMVFRGRVVGGSTLTQQLVKNALLTNERTIARKFKELVLSIQIERTFTKDQILEMYLNEAPYGGTAWGVGTAAEIYFDKPIQELSLVESAFLAGLPQRPSAYSPFSGQKDRDGTPLWKIRAESVLRAMENSGYITKLQLEDAIAGLNNLEFNTASADIKAPHFVFYVRNQLEEMFGTELVEAGGLKVTTTLDWELQDQAQQIVEDEINKVVNLNITNGAVVVMKPDTGEILSMVGSKDYFDDEIDGQYNVAADGLRQPGSSIKPVTYLAMFRRGYSPTSMLMDVETTFQPNDKIEPYTPKNYDGIFHGPVSIRSALGSSINIPAVKSVAIVGIEDFLRTAYELGFETLEPTKANLQRFGYSITLGGGEVHLLDTVSAYSAFANGGLKVQPVSILKVEDKDGRVLFEHKHVEGKRVMSKGEAFLINDILSDNNARLLAFGANSLLNTGRPIAVKTGTTNEQKDNWTIGWSREVMVGTWVGNSNNTSMTQVASGITGASPIWRQVIMAAIEMGYKTPAWEVPTDEVVSAEVDSISGFPAHDGYPSKTDYFLKGSVPTIPDPIHTKLKVCRDDNNKLATDAKVSAGDFDEKEFIVLKENDPVSEDGRNRWQEAINAWIGGQSDTRYRVPTEYCGENSDISVKVSQPENEKSYNQQDLEVHVDAGSGQGIEKMEIWVDGKLRETINDHSYRGKLSFPTGKHEIYAIAFSRDGKQAKSNTVKFGSGGADWKDPEPTPTPTPTSLIPTP